MTSEKITRFTNFDFPKQTLEQSKLENKKKVGMKNKSIPK